MQPQETGPVAVWCEVLDVSRRGFYASARRRAVPQLDQAEGGLLARVRASHTQTRPSEGRRRMAKQLQAEGWPGGRDKARRWMQAAGVAVRPRARAPVTTASRHG
jgi:putative transposase